MSYGSRRLPIAHFESQRSPLSGCFIIHTCLPAIFTGYLIRNAYWPIFIVQVVNLLYPSLSRDCHVTKYYFGAKHFLQHKQYWHSSVPFSLCPYPRAAFSWFILISMPNSVLKLFLMTLHTNTPLQFLCYCWAENCPPFNWCLVSGSLSLRWCLKFCVNTDRL